MTGDQFNSDDDMKDLDELNGSFDNLDDIDEELDLNLSDDDSPTGYSSLDDVSETAPQHEDALEDSLEDYNEDNDESGFALPGIDPDTDTEFEHAMEGVDESGEDYGSDVSVANKGSRNKVLFAVAAIIGLSASASGALLMFSGAQQVESLSAQNTNIDEHWGNADFDEPWVNDETRHDQVESEKSDFGEADQLVIGDGESQTDADDRQVPGSSVELAMARFNSSSSQPARMQTEATSDELSRNRDDFDPDAFKESIMTEMRSLLTDSVIAERDGAEQDAQIVEALASLQREVSELRTAKAENVDTHSNIAPERVERQRLKGFHVINTTEDGTMSVVETPSGRINVYFEGEVFNVDGAPMTVSSIDDNGMLVLVGEEYFIDSVREPKPRVAAATRSSAEGASNNVQDSRTSSETAIEERVYSYEGSIQKVSSVPAPSSAVMEPQIATGWNLNANMAQGYLVKGPMGEFQLVQQGDRIEGLGIVDGLDNNGFLRVGMYKIPRG